MKMPVITWKNIRREIKLMINSMIQARLYGTTGWSDGSVVGENRLNYLRVTLLSDNTEVEAWNDGVPQIAGLQVELYSDPEFPGILYATRPRLAFTKDFPFISMQFHRSNHTWPGPDTIAVELRQFMPLNPSVSGFNLHVRSGWVETIDGLKYFPGDYLNLNSHRPSGGARYVLVSINEEGLLNSIDGDIKGLYELTVYDIPALPRGHTRVCAIRLRIGQASILDNATNPDLLDLRFTQGLTGDMLRSVYDPDNDGVVELSENIDGINSAGNSKYYGTNESGTPGFHNLPSGDVEEAPLLGGPYGRQNQDWVEITGSGSSEQVTNPYVVLREEGVGFVDNIGLVSGDWRTRPINVKHIDTDNICTLSANRFTLGPGKYRLKARIPGYFVDNHQARLYDITNGVALDVGTSERSGREASNTIHSIITYRLAINATTTFEIQHRGYSTNAGNGMGVGAPWADKQVWGVVEIWKEITPSEPILENWKIPTLLNGWVNYGSGYADVGYYKHNGRVYLRGLLRSGTIDAAIFTLEEGYRPNGQLILGAVTVNGTFARLDVKPNGDVWAANGSNAYYSISGASFRVGD